MFSLGDLARVVLVICALAVAVNEAVPCAEQDVTIKWNPIPWYLRNPPEHAGENDSVVIIRLQSELWISFNYGENFTKQELALSFSSAVFKIGQHLLFLPVGSTLYRAHLNDTLKNPPPNNQLVWERVELEVTQVIQVTHAPDQGLVLVASSAECANTAENNCSTDIWTSKDWGRTWARVRRYVDGWALLSGPGNPLAVLEYADKSGVSQYLRVANTSAWQKNIVLSKDFFQTEYGLLTNVEQYDAKQDAVFAWKRVNATVVSMFVFRNAAGDEHWSQAHFRPEHVSFSTRISYLEGDAVFALLQQSDGTAADLFSSDGSNWNFALSLKNVAGDNAAAAFVKVPSIEGHYLVNQEIPAAGSHSVKRTLWSQDEGATWQPLAAPPGSSCPQTGACFLNLDISDPTYGGMTDSEVRGPAIVLAEGQLGEYLNYTSPESALYFSRDAGKNFVKVTEGGQHIAALAHGRILLSIPRHTPGSPKQSQNVLVWTANEGKSWNECTFELESPNSMVTTLYSLPGHAIAIALATSTSPGHSLLGFLDFRAVLPRPCAGDSNPGAPDSDFELWTPTTPNGEYCIMGANTTYVRPKVGIQCFLQRRLHRVHSQTPCPCSLRDYECDACYERDEASGKCVIDCEDFNGHQAPEHCVGTWWETDGFRLIPQNMCNLTTGIDLRPKQRTCPAAAPTTPITPPPVVTPTPVSPPVEQPAPVSAPVAPAPVPTGEVPVQPPKEAPAPFTPPAEPTPPPTPVSPPTVPVATPTPTAPIDSEPAAEPGPNAEPTPNSHSPQNSPLFVVLPPHILSNPHISAIVGGVLAVILAVGGAIGTLMYLSSRRSGVRSCMLKVFPESCVPQLQSYRYTRVNMETEMAEDEEIFDEHLLEEDADLIDADEERFRR